MSNTLIVLPRPGAAKPDNTLPPIPAPSEDAFIETFGSLLPRASYLQTQNGKAAYYELLPSSPPPTDSTTTPSRVLFVHGVQTCAIGLQPLASALSSRFPHAHCVLFDQWGHGLTETPLVAHDAPLFHALLEAVMAKLGWEDAHLVGYSFGASTTASFAAAKPERVASMVLVAPAGFIREAQFNEVQRSYLRGGDGLEEKAKEWVIEFLEGGQLAVPSDWKERVSRGEMVPEAVRDWQMKNHKGHAASVVAILRDGGVIDKDAEFAKAAKTGREYLCILGELDDLSTVQDFHNVGMQNVAVVAQVGHGVVREKVPEVARLIEDFWKKLS
ncbi:putative valacyclovir hydrolase [Ilyonectria robusta]|uniref:putative valacyclovir hydrolase n=1 Tax=Ilyonectria robusta TaxID=1079257 RepID=UPI001E8D256E|nr:putative valacyclovir hydrolase [Ilyonectria robusta]KAH8664886.1 putative valacyclovir hydrolase [Ilyonectria robusta]